MMETRIAIVGIVVEDFKATQEVNDILHQYREYIIGRMGIPYAKKNIAVISVVMDAPADKISALSGRLGQLKGVSSKTTYSKLASEEKEEKE